jgi:uncharacterized protein YecE (DUF72 family)
MPKARVAAKARTRVQARVGRKTSEIRVGISGWRYADWRGKFYPKGLPQSRELEFASHIFNSIEINGSFYSLQLPSSYRRWYSETPPDFVFSVKGARFITHMKKLRDVKTPLANFFASGVLALREKLGPILWQLPPNFGWNKQRLTEFFELLPRDTAEATRLAKRHDDKLKARAWTKIDISRPLRYALEVRHPTFMVPEFIELLREYDIAFVFADTAGKWPYAEDLSADFVYIRLHGSEKLYVSGYSDKEIEWWANRIEHWRNGKQPRDAKLIASRKIDKRASGLERDVFVYFDNDAKVHAPFDAQRLAARLRSKK